MLLQLEQLPGVFTEDGCLVNRGVPGPVEQAPNLRYFRGMMKPGPVGSEHNLRGSVRLEEFDELRLLQCMSCVRRVEVEVGRRSKIAAQTIEIRGKPAHVGPDEADRRVSQAQLSKLHRGG